MFSTGGVHEITNEHNNFANQALLKTLNLRANIVQLNNITNYNGSSFAITSGTATMDTLTVADAGTITDLNIQLTLYTTHL